ncbi:T9SS type B sorting domain-containing protein [Ancylomarina salipaludis]|uniref:T9SS type B sorting domain-containing protein n=1 Tax=Ancylomarina salipaludis TaxID=2501299 RepID=A0A4Q1JQI9_9BACT|nr:gliding motility-associated C-terminal domain-containing protein [Ancylomarina salipaludis]RXQ97626.1 T9SS type B sorting domain-containing protein [Ancylomarina salipaludis]
MNTKAISLIYIIILLSFSSAVNAKDFYWIGGSGNWNEIQHWSDQPGGQINPDAAVPNFGDNVFFDENSFPVPGAVVLINDVAKCANMDWSNVTNLPTLKADNDPAHFLTIYGGLKLSSNMLLDLLKPLYFSASTPNNEIDFAGHTYNNDIYFTKNGGWIIKTPLHVQNHIIYFEQGNLSFEADITCAQIIADNPISRTWNLNNSNITLSESGASVLKINSDNLNLNPGNSKITITGTNASLDISGNSTINLYDVEFQKNGAGVYNDALKVNFNQLEFLAGGNLKGSNQFQNLIFTKGNNYLIYSGADQTIQNLFTAEGSCSQHISISGVDGNGTIIANSTSLDFLKVKNMVASGTAAPFNATSSFNLGGNTDWKITSPLPQNYNWIGGTDNKWNTPTNWDGNCVPSRIDNATINGSFNVEIDADSECKDLSLSNAVTLSGSSSLSIFGSLDAGNAIWNLVGNCHFEGDANHTISIINSFKADVYFSGNGTWQLLTELKIPDHALYLESGNIISNNNNLDLNQFLSIGDLNRSLDLGISTLRLNGNFLKTWDVEGSHFTIPNNDYLIELIQQTAGFYNNHISTITYNRVHFNDPREKANLTNESSATVNFKELQFLAGANISGDHNFDTFILSAGKTYLFETGSQQKILNKDGFIAEGSCSEFIYLTGNGGVSTIISDVNSDRITNVQITDLEVTGGVTLSGGLNAANSFGISNYTGWNIIPKGGSDDFIWKGTEDSDWFNPKNWDPECVPTRLDNVFFDAGNLTPGGSSTITVNGTRIPECNNMTWSNASSLKFDGNSDLYIYGSLDFSSLPAGSFTYDGIIYFKSENDVNIKLDQVSLSNNVIFEGTIQENSLWLAGTWTIDSNFETSGDIQLKRGKLISNNFDISCNELYSNFSDDRTLQLDASILHLNGIFLSPENLNFISGTSEIIVGENGRVEVTTGTDAVAFNKVTFDQETGTALFAIRGKNVSFNQIDVKSNANFLYGGFNVDNLILNQGKTYKFTQGEIYNIGDITAIGTCEGTIDISSLSAGSETTFNSKNGNPISVNQVNLIDVFATPPATFTANNSIDLGHNDGWIFATTPTTRNLFWVGGSGTWDDPAHWSETSGGSPGACVPTALDNVYFDINSFSGKNQVVSTGSGDIRCRTMDWRGSEGTSPIFQMGTIAISSVYMYGSFILNENLTVNIPDVDFYFRSTEKGNTLILHDFSFPNNVTFDGIGGEWTLANNLDIDGNLFLDNGDFISAGFDVSCNYFESSDLTFSGRKRTLDIRNSKFTILGYENSFSVNIDAADINARQTLTLLADGSEVIIESEKAFFIGGAFTSNVTFNAIRFNNKGSLRSENLVTRINDLTYEQGGELNGTLNIGKLTLNKGTQPNTFEFESNVTFPIEEFTALGSCNFPIDIRASKSGKQANLEVKNSVNVNFTVLTDINGVGSSVAYIANNSIENTNVTNWTVNPVAAIDLYWVGNGLNDEWSNHLNWSKTSGGTSEGCVPTELDNVFFDDKSFLGSKTVLINSDARCHNITWTDDVDPSSIFTVQNQLDVHGSLDFSENMTLEMSGDLKFKGDGLTADKPIDFAGKALDGDIYFDGKDQSWILQNNLSTSGDLFLENGAFDTKGNKMSLSSFSSLNSSPLASRKLNISGSIVTVNAEKFKSWSMIFIGSPLEFTAVNSELYFPKKGGIYCESSNDVKFGDAIFDGYGEIDVNGNGFETGKGEFKTVIFRQQGQIFGDHTISNLEFTLGYGENSIQAGRTINLTNELIMEGVNCSYVYLKSSKDGEQAFINSSKELTIYHASLENIKMTDSNNHWVVGKYLNVGGSSVGWVATAKDDDSEEAPSFKETLPVRQEWCSSTASLNHVTYFPINDRTTFQWAYSPDGSAPYIDEAGETSATIVVNKSGFYRVEINYNNPNGDPCLLYSTIEVVMNTTSDIVIEFTTTNVQCYGNSDGFIKAVAQNGNAPFTFYWEDETGKTVDASSPLGTNESYASKLAPGKYFVQVKDDKGCDQTNSVDIFNAYEMFINNITKKDLKCFNITDGEIDIDASGGTGTLTYYLDGNLGAAHNTGLSAEEYIIHVQDGNNCKSDEESVEILSPEEITFDFASTDILCAGDKNGSIDPQIKGGVAPYNVNWTGSNGFNSTDAIITDLEGATYTIEVTDANNCVYTTPFELLEPEEIILSNTIVKDANCFGESSGEIFVEADKGTAPYTYTIDATTNTSGQFNDLAANTYALKVTDKNACVKLQDITIKEPMEMGFIVADNISPTCNDLKDGIINIVPYGGNNDYTFSWSGPNDFRSYTKNNTGLDFGDYTLLLKDKKECTLEETISLVKSTPLQLGLVIEEEVTAPGANDGRFRLEILGGTIPYTYTVSGPNGYSNFSPSFFDEDKALFENLEGGLYTVTITDESSCGSITKDIMLPEGNLLIAQIIDQEDVSCIGYNDGALNATAIGGDGSYSYSWSGPSGFTANSKSISALIPGTYTLTVQSAGQSATDQTIILEPAPLDASSILNNVACFNEPNGSIELDITGGTKPYSIFWTGDRGLFSHSDKIYDLAEGDYDYKITDTRGCFLSNTLTISQPDAVAISQTHTDITDMGLRDGTITATATGGTPPYTIFISGPNEYSKKSLNNQTGIYTVDFLEQGVYVVEVLDANECRAVTETRIYEQEKMVVSLVSKTSPICHGGEEGSIEIIVEDGSGDYTLSWEADNHYKKTVLLNTSQTSKIENLKAGNYTLTVTDNTTNEVITFKQEVTEPDLVEVEYGIHNISCYGKTDGSINIYPKGGTPNYNYIWEGDIAPNNLNNEDQKNLSPGLYNVTVTDSRNCISEKYLFEVKAPEVFSGVSSITEPLCYGDKNGEVKLDITSGAIPYTISWNTGAITQDISGLRIGTYSCTVIDNKNCEFRDTVILTQPDSLIAEINTFNDVRCYGLNNGDASATVNGGTIPYSFNWSNGETTENINNLRPKKYELIVTDQHNCQDTASVVIQEPEELLLKAEANRPTVEGANDGAIFSKALGGIPNYTATWEIETGADIWSNLSEPNLEINNLDRGKYKLTLSDQNSCSVDTIINLEYLYDRMIEIPKAFTPNHDGYNDYWDILRIEYIQRLKIVIYDRLGATVYTFSGTGNEYKGNPWTGTNKNSHLPIGSYYYAIEADDSKPLTGTVTIAR